MATKTKTAKKLAKKPAGAKKKSFGDLSVDKWVEAIKDLRQRVRALEVAVAIPSPPGTPDIP